MDTLWQRHAESLSRIFPAVRLESEPMSALEGADAAVAVACSGGADSLSVLLLTWALFPNLRGRICVLHYNHMQRGDASDGDENFVREVCAGLGEKFFCGHLPKEISSSHAEGALREARLSFFANEMLRAGTKILVQGHQAGDVEESLIMRISRGAGTDGLAAPRPVSKQGDGRIFVRPLLCISKTEIIAALRTCGIPWREDASNAGEDYFRNRVRNTVLPALHKAACVENFARSRKLAQEDADALAEIADAIKLGESKSPAIVRRQLWKALSTEKITPCAKNVDSLVDAVCAGTAFGFTAGNTRIFWTGGKLNISKVDTQTLLPQDFEVEEVKISDELFEQIKAGKFSEKETVFLAGTVEIHVRHWQTGDRYKPLGSLGEKLVSDVFIDKKIPRENRETLPVFCDGTGIAWIPGLPPAERFRITKAGTVALRLTYCGASLT